MPPKKSYKIGGKVVDIPEENADKFLQRYPNAQEVRSFVRGKDTIDIPVENADKFIQKYPDAKPLGYDSPEVKQTSQPTETTQPQQAPVPQPASQKVTYAYDKQGNELQGSSALGMMGGAAGNIGVQPKAPKLIGGNQYLKHVEYQTDLPDVKAAIDKAVVAKNKLYGIAPDKADMTFGRGDIEQQIKNGNLVVGKDNKGEATLKRGAGFFESFNNALNQEYYKGLENNYLTSASKEDVIKHLNLKRTNPELTIAGKESDTAPKGVLGNIGETIGNNINFLLEKTAGALIGGAVTGGAGAAGSFIATAKEVANAGYAQGLEKNYNLLKDHHPEMSDDEAYEKAHTAALAGAATSLATDAAFTGSITGKTPLPTVPVDGAINAIKSVAKHIIKTAPKSVGTAAGGSIINDVVSNLEGAHVGASDVAKNAWEAGKQMAIMHTAFGVVAGIPEVLSATPTPLRPQLENILASAPREQVKDYFQQAEDQGDVPRGTTVNAINKLQEFDQQKKAVENLPVSEEKKAAITGKLLQRKGINEQIEALHQFGGAFNDRIKALNDQKEFIETDINEMVKSDNVFNHETDGLTGERLAISKTFEQLSKKEKEGVVVPKEYGKTDIIVQDDGDGNKTFTPVATVTEKRGGLEINNDLKVEGKFKDKEEAQKAASQALAQHYYDNAMHDGLKPIADETKQAEDHARRTENKQDNNGRSGAMGNTNTGKDDDMEGKVEIHQPTEEAQPATTGINQEEQGASAETKTADLFKEMTDADIEKRMADLENEFNGTPSSFKNPAESGEYNRLEKEMEKRERDSVFSVPLENVNDAIDALMKKEKEKPNGFGAFIEKKDAIETKRVAKKYMDAKNISDSEIKKDFKNAVMGNPDTWYADGLKLRESLKEAANRGIDIKDMIREVEKEFEKDGYTAEDARSVVARQLAPIFKDAKNVETNESKLIGGTKNAIKEGEQPQNNSGEYRDRNQGGKAAEAGGGDSSEQSREEQKEKVTPPSEPELTGITHAQMDDTARQLGLEEYEEKPETVAEWDAEADKRIREEPNAIPKLVDKLQKGGTPSAVEQRMMLRYISSLKARIADNPTDANLAEYKTAAELSNIAGGRDVAKSLVARKGGVPVEDTLADALLEKMEDKGVDILTEKEKSDVAKQYEEMKAAKESAEQKASELQALLEIERQKKGKSTAKKTGVKKTHEEYVKDRQAIVAKMREDLLNIAKGKEGFKSDIPLVAQLRAADKHVTALVRNLLEEGVSELKAITKSVFDEMKAIVPDISEKDVHDLIAGKYRTAKQTQSDLAIKFRDLQTEAALINKLDALLKGEEPKTEKKKQQRNRQITELRDKIKNFKEEKTKAAAEQKRVSELKDRLDKLESGIRERKDKPVTKIESAEIEDLKAKIKLADEKLRKETSTNKNIDRLEQELKRLQSRQAKTKNPAKQKQLSQREVDLKALIEVERDKIKEENKKAPEEIALKSLLTRTNNEIKRVQEQIANKDFEPQAKNPSILDDPEAKRLFPQQYKDAIKAQDELIRLRNQKQLQRYRDGYDKMSTSLKFFNAAGEVLNVPRTLMSSLDFSAAGRQGLWMSIAHPQIAGKAFVEQFRFAKSKARFDRWFDAVRSSDMFAVAEKAGLYIADTNSPQLQAREEMFMSQLGEKVPLIGRTLRFKAGGKDLKIPGLDLVGGSERAYVGFLNKLRWDTFTMYADRYLDAGKTPENSPELYTALGRYINNGTGRGAISGKLETASPILNSVLFSPRLIASRINLLTDILNPAYYKKTPKEIRVMYLKDYGKFVATGLATMALMHYGFGAETETDPRSSDFGKIKFGNTRYDIWGGFGQYVVLLSRLFSGAVKNTTDKTIKDLDGKGAFGQDRSDVAWRFLRGKLAPIPGSAIDLAKGKNIVGEPVTLKSTLERNLLPLIISDLQDAYKDKGVAGIYQTVIPSTFGVGVSTYDTKPTFSSGGGSRTNSRSSDRTSSRTNSR